MSEAVREILFRPAGATDWPTLSALLTPVETAHRRGVFPKFGFRAITRDTALDVVKDSVEFVSACPQSAVVMQFDLLERR
jgi:hypothetical protein